MRYLSPVVIAAASALVSQIASAADIPVKKPVYKAPLVAVAYRSWYFWLDGIYDRVRLPSYALGIHNIGTSAPFPDLGPAQSLDRKLDGGGLRGALGYVMPGSGIRLEVGGLWVSANGSSSSSPSLSADAQTVFLNGVFPASLLGAFACNGVGGTTCAMTGNLSTSYDAWEINGKVATDWKYGWVTVTPSVAIFGGNTHDNDTLYQLFTQAPGGRMGSYFASTALHWTDVGGRVGVDITVPVNIVLKLGIGGWIGAADRSASLSGFDEASSSPFNVFNGAGAVSTSSSRGVFLANLEAGLAYAFNPALTLRGFVGLNYDNSVPGIAPSSGGSLNAPAATPAGISYTPETSYYAGGGVKLRF